MFLTVLLLSTFFSVSLCAPPFDFCDFIPSPVPSPFFVCLPPVLVTIPIPNLFFCVFDLGPFWRPFPLVSRSCVQTSLNCMFVVLVCGYLSMGLRGLLSRRVTFFSFFFFPNAFTFLLLPFDADLPKIPDL